MVLSTTWNALQLGRADAHGSPQQKAMIRFKLSLLQVACPNILGSGKAKLVGGFNPSQKYARQIGSFPQLQ